jgi:hypothetical protein
MSIDIPAAVEPQIRKFAQTEHLTIDEAVARLLQAGLDAQTNDTANLDTLVGAPPTQEEAAIMDEIVDEAMKARASRW